MLLTSDKAYLDAKRLKQGKRVLKAPFDELAEWIGHKFGATVLNVVPDRIVKGVQPTQSIAVERERDLWMLCNKDRYTCNSRKAAAVSRKYLSLIEDATRHRSVTVQKTRALLEMGALAEDGVRIWVDVFEPLAKQEANGSVTKSEIDAMAGRLGLDDLWTVFNGWTIPVFFFYTEMQAAQHRTDGTIENLKAAYFKLLKRYDEFGYYTPDTFDVSLDSKENFDTRYSGNWYYFLK